jgi:hypothetical protein
MSLSPEGADVVSIRNIAMSKLLTVEQSVQKATQNPGHNYTVLAKTLAAVMNKQPWIDCAMKKMFCVLFMKNILDRSVERSVDDGLLRAIKSKPLPTGIRFLRRVPGKGLDVLVAIISCELRVTQQLNEDEQMAFFRVLVDCLFPEKTPGRDSDQCIQFDLVKTRNVGILEIAL